MGNEHALAPERTSEALGELGFNVVVNVHGLHLLIEVLNGTLVILLYHGLGEVLGSLPLKRLSVGRAVGLDLLGQDGSHVLDRVQGLEREVDGVVRRLI